MCVSLSLSLSLYIYIYMYRYIWVCIRFSYKSGGKYGCTHSRLLTWASNGTGPEGKGLRYGCGEGVSAIKKNMYDIIPVMYVCVCTCECMHIRVCIKKESMVTKMLMMWHSRWLLLCHLCFYLLFEFFRIIYYLYNEKAILSIANIIF